VRGLLGHALRLPGLPRFRQDSPTTSASPIATKNGDRTVNFLAVCRLRGGSDEEVEGLMMAPFRHGERRLRSSRCCVTIQRGYGNDDYDEHD